MQADLVFTGGTSYTPDPSRRRLVPLAAAPGGGFQALTARGGLLSVWTLGTSLTGWHRSQALSVTIPYGSSG